MTENLHTYYWLKNLHISAWCAVYQNVWETEQVEDKIRSHRPKEPFMAGQKYLKVKSSIGKKSSKDVAQDLRDPFAFHLTLIRKRKKSLATGLLSNEFKKYDESQERVTTVSVYTIHAVCNPASGFGVFLNLMEL